MKVSISNGVTGIMQVHEMHINFNYTNWAGNNRERKQNSKNYEILNALRCWL